MQHGGCVDKQPALVEYAGNVKANIDYHDGQLRPAVGVQSYQVQRCNRSHPDLADGYGWTYNHAPMLAHWRGRFYLEYLSNPIGEHTPPGQTLLTDSGDGRNWSRPRVVFPPYMVPDGVYPDEAPYRLMPATFAVMHQRMGFYVAPNDRLLVLGFYGICPHPRSSPQDGRGIGRVVREVHADGTLSPIYFIRYNRHAGWNETNTRYPHYAQAPDAGFVDACETLVANRLMTMQWWEEDRSEEGFYAVTGYQAPSFYHAADGRVVGLWKWSRAAVSTDEGRSWSPVAAVPSLVMAGAKIWGQRTNDGRYALVYNPSTHGYHRWPLAIVTGDDGYVFDNLLCVAGHVPPRRYYGHAKDFGAQYVRGIVEGNGSPADGDLWLAYSMNKEDIWVSRVPVPVRARVDETVDDDFSSMAAHGEIPDWNIYSPLWAPIALAPATDGSGNCLELRDADPCDAARAERVFPESTQVRISARIMAASLGTDGLYVHVRDARGQVPVRVWLDSAGHLWAMDGCLPRDLGEFPVDEWCDIEIAVDADMQRFEVACEQLGISAAFAFDASVSSVERILFATGNPARTPLPDTPRDPGADLMDVDLPTRESAFRIARLRACRAR